MKEHQLKVNKTYFFHERAPQGYASNRSKIQLRSKDTSIVSLKKRSRNETVSQDKENFQSLKSINLTASIHPSQLQCRQQCYRQMEMSLQSQNSNLKQHNSFLLIQVKGMFQREKKYRKMLTLFNAKLRKLEYLNHHLHQQIRKLSSNTLMQIERMQKIAKDQSVFEEELRISGKEDHKNSQVLGWETECSLNQNLEYLKKQVCDFFNEHATLGLNDLYLGDSKRLQSKKSVYRPIKQEQKKAGNSSGVFQVKHKNKREIIAVDSLQKLEVLGWKKINIHEKKHN